MPHPRIHSYALLPLVLAALVGAIAPSPAAGPVASPVAPTIVWDPVDVQVSGAPLYAGDIYGIAEPSIGIDPTDPQRMVAVAFDHSTQNHDPLIWSTNIHYLSEDGGITWQDLGPFASGIDLPVTDGGDPVVVYDAQGRAFVSLLVDPRDDWRWIQVFRSDDGGVTWNEPVNAHVAPPRDPLTDTCFSVDKEWLSLGNEPDELLLTYTGSVFTCTLGDEPTGGGELVAIRDIGIYLRRSTDGGLTWSAQQKISQGTGYAITSHPAEAPDGTLHVAYLAMVPATDLPCPSAIGTVLVPSTRGGAFAAQVVATSRDEGRTWSYHQQGTCVAELHPDGVGGGDFMNTFAVDAARGAAYLAYVNWKPLEDRFAISLIASHDGGATWTQPIEPVPTPFTSRFAALEAVDGVVYLAYEALDGNGLAWTELIVSADGGASWSAPMRLSTAPGAGGGDYIGLDVAGGRITVAWTDMRDGEGAIWSRSGTVSA